MRPRLAITAAPESYGQLLYGFSQSRERGRIGLIGSVCDPRTRHSVGGLAPPSAWRRLDVGAGTGNVTRWLTDQMVDPGQIVASKRDASLLRDTNHLCLILGADVADPYVTRMLTSF